jgi:hypothetical protein
VPPPPPPLLALQGKAGVAGSPKAGPPTTAW